MHWDGILLDIPFCAVHKRYQLERKSGARFPRKLRLVEGSAKEYLDLSNSDDERALVKKAGEEIEKYN